MTNENKAKRIKELLESTSGFENIGIRSRKKPIPDLKKYFCKLCSDYTNLSLSSIGFILGEFDHTTALHHKNSFDGIFSTSGFETIYIYNRVKDFIDNDERFSKKEDNKPQTIEEVSKSFLQRAVLMTIKYRSIISKQSKDIKRFKTLLHNNDIDY